MTNFDSLTTEFIADLQFDHGTNVDTPIRLWYEMRQYIRDAHNYRSIINQIEQEQKAMDNPEPNTPSVTCCFLQRAICDCKELT